MAKRAPDRVRSGLKWPSVAARHSRTLSSSVSSSATSSPVVPVPSGAGPRASSEIRSRIWSAP